MEALEALARRVARAEQALTLIQTTATLDKPSRRLHAGVRAAQEKLTSLNVRSDVRSEGAAVLDGLQRLAYEKRIGARRSVAATGSEKDEKTAARLRARALSSRLADTQPFSELISDFERSEAALDAATRQLPQQEERRDFASRAQQLGEHTSTLLRRARERPPAPSPAAARAGLDDAMRDLEDFREAEVEAAARRESEARGPTRELSSQSLEAHREWAAEWAAEGADALQREDERQLNLREQLHGSGWADSDRDTRDQKRRLAAAQERATRLHELSVAVERLEAARASGTGPA